MHTSKYRCSRVRVTAGLAILAALILSLGGAADVAAAPGEYHIDKKLGYKVKSPRDWRQIAMGGDEKWIAAKFLSNKTCYWTDKESQMTAEHKPVMQVIVFIDEVVKKRGLEIEKDDEDNAVSIIFNNPYKDYEDFLKNTYSGGGWHVSDEEQGTLKGCDVTKYEIKVEKLSHTGPKRIVTWVFHTPEVDFAVQFEVLEGDYKKFRSDIHGCLKSFRIIEREGSLTDVTTGQRVKQKNEDDLSQEERTAYRKQTEAAEHRKAQKNLTDGWKVYEIGRFLVLNHADAKYAKKTAAHGEAVWKWLDKNFSYVGEGEYVRRPVLRICKDPDEERAFREGTGWWGNSLEIVTHQDKSSGAMSWELEYVNNRIYEIWFRHRNGELYYAMPYWLRTGLKQVLGTARAKGSRLEFKVDDWERDGLRESVKKNELTTPRDLVSLGRGEFNQNQNRQKQSAAFIRFLLNSKKKKTRMILEDYMRNLQVVVMETVEKERAERKKRLESDAAPDRPETEEEEEAAFKARQSMYEAKEAEFLKEVFDRTFGDWSDKDWKRLEALFFKSI